MRSKQACKDEDEEEEEEEDEDEDEGEDEEDGDDWVDDEGTKRIEQCVSSAEFVRLMRQNWIRENLPAAIQRDVQSVVEHHQNALTSALPRRGRRRRSRKRKKEDEDETEKRTRKRRKKREMKVGDDRVDGEGT